LVDVIIKIILWDKKCFILEDGYDLVDSFSYIFGDPNFDNWGNFFIARIDNVDAQAHIDYLFTFVLLWRDYY